MHRNMHRALHRQMEGYVICKWGCAAWVKEGQVHSITTTLPHRHTVTPPRNYTTAPSRPISDPCPTTPVPHHTTLPPRQAEHFHQREQCTKRIVQCLLGCPMQLREEQWLEGALDFQPPAEEDDGEGFQFSDEQQVGFRKSTTLHSTITSFHHSTKPLPHHCTGVPLNVHARFDT